MKTPIYVTTEEVHISTASSRYAVGMGNSPVLPVGAFVKPINKNYLPKHIFDDKRWKDINLDIYVFCYTRYGIVPIPLDVLRLS